MNVLSLFDGISCGRLALERANLKVSSYFASEINKFALYIAQRHYPDNIQLGDITSIKGSHLPKIDLVIGGSPCQGFSFAGQRGNFQDSRSLLFFEFVRLLEECGRPYFLFENVCMAEESKNIITKYLGVSPVLIDSSLFSAQSRKRLYWTNIPIFPLPESNRLTTEDILEKIVDVKYYLSVERAIDLCEYWVAKKRIRYLGIKKGNRLYQIRNQTISLCDFNGELDMYTGQFSLPALMYHKKQRGLPFRAPFSKSYTITAKFQPGILTSNFMRKFSPLECERLQTLPDNYTKGISDTQRYIAVGNGWTIDVITHILKSLA